VQRFDDIQKGLETDSASKVCKPLSFDRENASHPFSYFFICHDASCCRFDWIDFVLEIRFPDEQSSRWIT
jgi:hypothetical protein